MKTQRKKVAGPRPPALVWRVFNKERDASGEEVPGPQYCSLGVSPHPAEVLSHGLRAWFWCESCASYRPTPAGYGGENYAGGTGYGYDGNGADARAMCYRCCGERDKRDMESTGAATLYITRKPDAPTAKERGEHWHADSHTGRGGYGRTRAHLRAQDWSVSNWPGSLTFPVYTIKRGAHNWHNVERIDVWFIFGARVWHGVNVGDSQILRCKRTRQEWRQRPDGEGYYAHTPRKSRAKPSARRACTTCGKPIEVRENSRAHLASVYPCHDCATLARLSASTRREVSQ